MRRWARSSAARGKCAARPASPWRGGHSIDDAEPKFGLVAIGLGDPDRLWRKGGARPGDALVLGKALGTGVVTTGLKHGVTDPADLLVAVDSMRQLNREAVAVLSDFDVHAATDVTGFGLLGHLLEMCNASDASARIRASTPKLLPGALRLAGEGCVPGGTTRNRDAYASQVRWDDAVPDDLRTLLLDPQTSGGLLAAVPAHEASSASSALVAAGYAAAGDRRNHRARRTGGRGRGRAVTAPRTRGGPPASAGALERSVAARTFHPPSGPVAQPVRAGDS